MYCRLGSVSGSAHTSQSTLPTQIGPLAGELFEALRVQNGVLADHPHAQQYSTLQVQSLILHLCTVILVI